MRDIPSSVKDRVFGQITFTKTDMELFQSKILTRLRQVSLSNYPAWTQPASDVVSRFEHSLGVAHLSQVVGAIKGFEDISNDLYLASLFHDAGTPPFSHAGEVFQEKVLGVDHEKRVVLLFKDPVVTRLFMERGSSVERVSGLITGDTEDPRGVVLNGSLDIDNLDNIIRFGLSIGLFRRAPYNPVKIASGFALRNGKVVLLEGVKSEVKRWEKARKRIYEYVYSKANISPGVQIGSALNFAYETG